MNQYSSAFSGGAIVILLSTITLASLAIVSLTTLVAPTACLLERYFGLI